MAFCEYSSEVISKSSISVDNVFITEFLPSAPDGFVKVYLYGIYKCASAKDNSLDSFARVLQMSKEDVVSIFYYWQEMGLVQVLDTDPVQIRYLPVKNALQKMKKYNVDKYVSFNMTAQDLFENKMLTPREFEEFYYLIENLKMEKEAVLKIIGYCIELKGNKVSINYITTVARSWAYDGVLTLKDVLDRIEDQERISGDITLILKTMGLKRTATVDEYQMFLNWLNDLEMALPIITHIAKVSKSKNFAKLDEYVRKCYSQKLESEKEIDDYFAMQNSMIDLAKKVVKNLGLYYQNIMTVVDEYVTNWCQLGFDADALIKLSNYAFKTSIRTLEAFNSYVLSLFKVGVITSQTIDNYIEDIVKNDKIIKDLLCSMGINREVNATDRGLYKTWLYDWNLNADIIEYGASLAKDKYLPIQYLNKVLAEFRNAGVKTLDDAQKINISTGASVVAKQSPKEAKKRNYTKKQLDSLYDNIFEVEI